MAQQVVVIEPDYFSVSVTAPQTVTISNTGPQGAKGDTGATGPTGPQGPTGATGAPGVVQTVSGTSPITATGTTAITVGINQGSITIAESQVTNLVTDLAAKAPLASPALTGSPTSTTAALTTSTTQIATTAFVDQNTEDIRQFAADKSVLDNIPARIHPAEQLLKQAVFWIDANHSSASGQTITNLGWGGSTLNATAGSTGSADSNDPKYLGWSGTNYIYTPGSTANCLSVPDADNLDITGDIDIRYFGALDDWTPAARSPLIAKADTSNSWRLHIETSGVVSFWWYDSGSTLQTAQSTVAPTVSDGADLWIRVTLDVDNGASGRDIKFFTSTDGATWNQLGTTVTQAGTTSIFAGTSPIFINQLASGSGTVTAGKFYRTQVLNGISGTPVLDVDASLISSGSNTSFTALTGQTVTIFRSTSGRKTVAVTTPCWLFGTDDYMEVADNDLLDFGATDSFTVVAVVRRWATATTNMWAVNKSNGFNALGWGAVNGFATNGRIMVSDGTNTVYGESGTVTLGVTATIVGVRDKSLGKAFIYYNGTSGTQVTDTSGSLANSSALRVGRSSDPVNPYYADMELVAAAVFRRALTAAEITTLNNYFQGRAS